MKVVNAEGQRTIPGKSAYAYEIEQICEAMRALSFGQYVTYKDLSALVGMDIRGGVPVINAARNKLLKEDRIRTECITGVGIKRIDNDEIVKYAVRGRVSVNRKARREVKKLEALDISLLGDGKLQIRAMTEASVLGAIAIMSDSRRVSTQIKGVSGSAVDLPKLSDLRAIMSS